MGCTIPKKVNRSITNEIVVYMHNVDLAENEPHPAATKDEKSIIGDKSPVRLNNIRERRLGRQSGRTVRFEDEANVSSTAPQKSSTKSRRRRQGRKTKDFREFRDNGHRSFAGHSFVKEIFHEKLGLKYETHEEKMQINGKTYNPDIKFTWNHLVQGPILVYCEIKCVKQGAYTKLVQQVRAGRKYIGSKHTLFVGFLMREKKKLDLITTRSKDDPLSNFQKLEFVICEGYHASDFTKLIKSSGHFKIHPLFSCFDAFIEQESKIF